LRIPVLLKQFFMYLREKSIILLLYALLAAGIFIFYKNVVGLYATLFLIAVLAAYCISMAGSFFAMKKFLKAEKEQRLTPALTARLSFVIALPVYWCWLLFSLIPITSYYAWSITGFPLAIVSAFPLKAVADFWHGIHKIVFWGIHILLYPLFLILGQAVILSLF